MLKKILFISGSGLSLLLLWLAVSGYRAAGPIAGENLRGLALTLTAAVENSAAQDPSFRSMARFHPVDVAYFAIIDRNGTVRFHSNPDLIGSSMDDPGISEVFRNKSIAESRVVLGTGENAYAFVSPLYVHGEVLALRLTLHTYRADAVVRRARLNFAMLVSLLVAGWILAAGLYRFAKREELHQKEMARRENLARLGEMGAMLAHEIRNPLAGIKGYAQVIEKKPAEERNGRFAQSIVKEVVRLENLVNDLLDYARCEGYEVSPVGLKELLTHTVFFVRHGADQQSVSIVSECPEGVWIVGNRDRLGQVLLNLARNALQAMPEGGILSFSVAVSDREVAITVSDSGQGIEQGEMARIFEPFFTTKARGTGLGLPLCKKIVEEHNGRIIVESSAGKGTTVSLSFPRPKGGFPDGSGQ